MTLFDTHIVATFGKRFQGLVENAKPGSGASDYLEHLEKFWRTYQPFASPDFQLQLLGDDGKF